MARHRRAFGKVVKKNKRFYAEYPGPDGRRHTPGRSFDTKTDAEGWLSQEKRLLDLETWTPPKSRREEKARESVTVGDWLDKLP